MNEGVHTILQHLVELRQDIVGLRGELRSAESRLREDLGADIRHTNVLVEDLAGQIRLVAEGVDNVNERLDRFQKETAREFKETRSELRRAYGDLDGRVRRLEAASA
jgi:predicted  nucleic acid-binding Zn-ribbon protein